jgi:hypothetical protein
MGYIGAQPATNFETVRKQVSTTNSGTTITLDYSVSSVQDILVTVNAVVQSYDNYTVSGTTLTLGGTLNNDRVEILYVGRTFQTVTPAIGTVTNDMLSGSIANSKLATPPPTLTGSTDNTVVTVTGANAMQGEANLTYSSPDLTVGGGNPSIIHNNTTSGGDSGIKFQGSGVDYGFINLDNSDGALDLGTKVGWSTRFYTNNAERMNIDSSGRVNINTASAITGEGVLQVSGNSSQNLSAWRVATNGNVGLRFFNSSTQGVGGITINASGTVYATSSDYRLKENEVAISDGIERLKQLKPYKFNFKTEPDTIVDGFFAHEVSSVVPEAVSGEKDATETYIDDNGDEQTRINSQGIDQSKLVPLLTSALQEAITKIETLEARVQTLESE